MVGAGAAGGYLGAQLIDAGRAVTFLAHSSTRQRLASDGLRVRHGDETRTIVVDAVTAEDLAGPYDVVVIAVRTSGVAAAAEDIRAAVGTDTPIVPIMNGIRHLQTLTTAYGTSRVLGATTRLITSQLPDGTIDVVTPGVRMEIGALDGRHTGAVETAVAELRASTVEVSVRDDILDAMWEKFAFITSTAVLTCLVGDEIGPIARAEGGPDLARGVVGEVAAVAAAEGHALDPEFTAGLRRLVTDSASTFGPSMFRDMSAGRPVEITVLDDLADRARSHGVDAPLLQAALVRIGVHNRRLAPA